MDAEEERELLARLRARDEAAFAQLLDTWSGSMLRTARSIVGSAESAQDVVQETWLAVIRSIDDFEGRSSLRTWVFRILVNAARRRARVDGRITTLSLDVTDADRGPVVDPERFQATGEWQGHWAEFPAPWPGPEQRATDREWVAVLKDAVMALPARQQVVLTLRDIEGYASAEVQEILGISAGNERVLLHRARTTVRASLEAYFERAGQPAGPVTSGEPS